MSGLVQDYSKSPIKPQQERAIPAPHSDTALGSNTAQSVYTTNVIDQTFVPATMSPVHQAPAYAGYQQQQQAPPLRQSIDYGAPPTTRESNTRKSMSTERDSGLPDVVGYQVGQKHDSPVMPVPPRDVRYQPADAPVAPSTYVASGYGQQQPPPSGLSAGQDTLNGYRQNQVHDGGSTDYASENQSSLEMAEQAWQSASKTVGQYAGTAGETVGKVWEGGLKGVKGWLNPESKGMR